MYTNVLNSKSCLILVKGEGIDANLTWDYLELDQLKP